MKTTPLYVPLAGALALVLAIPGSSFSADGKCILGINKNASKVASTLFKEVGTCVKLADKAGAGDVEACVVADARNKVARAKQKTLDGDVGGARDKCANTAPAFAYAGASAANDAADSGVQNLARDLFGNDLNASIVTDGDKIKAKCRSSVYKSAAKTFATNLKLFNSCLQRLLLAGASSDAEIATCYQANSYLVADPKRQACKAKAKLASAATSACAGTDVDELLAGACVGAELQQCLVAVVNRRVCETASAMNGLSLDCEAPAAGTRLLLTELSAPARVCSGEELCCVDVSSSPEFVLRNSQLLLGEFDGDGPSQEVLMVTDQGSAVCDADELFECTEATVAGKQSSAHLMSGAADLDNDGAWDFFSWPNHTPGASRPAAVCEGDNAGGFSCIARTGFLGGQINGADVSKVWQAAPVGFLDADLHADIGVCTRETIEVCLNDGFGEFSCAEPASNPAGAFSCDDLQIADFDGDGLGDLLQCYQVGGPGGDRFRQVCMGDGFGGFSCAPAVETPRCDWILAADVNDDGFSDILQQNQVPGAIYSFEVCIGDGTGGFVCQTPEFNGWEAVARVTDGQRPVTLDLNADGHLDLALGQHDTRARFSIALCLGDGAGGFDCSQVTHLKSSRDATDALTPGLAF